MNAWYMPQPHTNSVQLRHVRTNPLSLLGRRGGGARSIDGEVPALIFNGRSPALHGYTHSFGRFSEARLSG
jgi:hypothetical protein